MAAQLGDRTTPVHTLFDEDDEPVPTVGEQNKQPDPAGAGGNSVEEVVVLMTVAKTVSLWIATSPLSRLVVLKYMTTLCANTCTQ